VHLIEAPPAQTEIHEEIIEKVETLNINDAPRSVRESDHSSVRVPSPARSSKSHRSHRSHSRRPSRSRRGSSPKKTEKIIDVHSDVVTVREVSPSRTAKSHRSHKSRKSRRSRSSSSSSSSSDSRTRIVERREVLEIDQDESNSLHVGPPALVIQPDRERRKSRVDRDVQEHSPVKSPSRTRRETIIVEERRTSRPAPPPEDDIVEVDEEDEEVAAAPGPEGAAPLSLAQLITALERVAHARLPVLRLDFDDSATPHPPMPNEGRRCIGWNRSNRCVRIGECSSRYRSLFYCISAVHDCVNIRLAHIQPVRRYVVIGIFYKDIAYPSEKLVSLSDDDDNGDNIGGGGDADADADAESGISLIRRRGHNIDLFRRLRKEVALLRGIRRFLSLKELCGFSIYQVVCPS
jgi:hypothetical protein